MADVFQHDGKWENIPMAHGLREAGHKKVTRVFVMFGAIVAIMAVLNDARAALHPGETLNRGKRLFAMCAGCHSLKQGKKFVGPSLYGLFGRRAGNVKGYRYSKALADSQIEWNERSLDHWLSSPRGFIPGNRMQFRGLKSPDNRKALISFLKRATQRN